MDSKPPLHPYAALTPEAAESSTAGASAEPYATEVFNCRMCGRCCEGSGGIILTGGDLQRISAHLEMSAEEFAASFAETRRGKLGIKAGPDGFCVFFKKDRGCSVHLGRPDICRAWPYFKGNISDPVSLEMAKEDCPGINPDAGFQEFRRQGLAYLKEHRLAHPRASDAPNALIVED